MKLADTVALKFHSLIDRSDDEGFVRYKGLAVAAPLFGFSVFLHVEREDYVLKSIGNLNLVRAHSFFAQRSHDHLLLLLLFFMFNLVAVTGTLRNIFEVSERPV